MKEPDDSLALPRPILKRSAEAPRPSSGLKLARQGPISKSRPGPSARGPVTVVDSPPSATQQLLLIVLLQLRIHVVALLEYFQRLPDAHLAILVWRHLA